VVKENRRMLIVNEILVVKFDVLIIIKKKTLVLDTSIGVGTTNIQNINNPTIEQYLYLMILFSKENQSRTRMTIVSPIFPSK